ncbi:MAG: GAF domain-containing protein [Marinirhabdus sp.]
MSFNPLKPKVTATLQNEGQTVQQRLEAVCALLRAGVGHYDWVGFYFADFKTRTLHLRAFAGAVTPHTVIPFGKGICGQVAVGNANFMVPDVKVQDNYIACSVSVKAELVVPLFKDGKNIGQIDIDSNTANPFSAEDEGFLEWVNKEVAKIINSEL